MARRDDLTGAKALNGYRSSHANNKTKHRFHLVFLQKKRFYIPEETGGVTLKGKRAKDPSDTINQRNGKFLRLLR